LPRALLARGEISALAGTSGPGRPARRRLPPRAAHVRRGSRDAGTRRTTRRLPLPRLGRGGRDAGSRSRWLPPGTRLSTRYTRRRPAGRGCCCCCGGVGACWRRRSPWRHAWTRRPAWRARSARLLSRGGEACWAQQARRGRDAWVGVKVRVSVSVRVRVWVWARARVRVRVRVWVRVRVRVRAAATPGLGVRVAAVAAPGLDERAAPALDGKEPHVRTPPAAGGLARGAESSPWASECEA